MEREAEVLFSELADLSPAQREQYFRSRVVSPALRAEVESLLEYDSGTHPVFADCIERSAAQVVETTAFRTEPPAPGGLFGSYRLVRLLGRGGMSAVYLAERADGEVKQNVAIKLLRYGSDEPAFRDRFLRERQILASLNHHGIARLLDAGHTPDGQPYLVMEYIDGTPIDEAAGRLDLRAKLELFLAACDAISYAHRNLVIHRDLKPSNILVDAAGRPKLLDFGIAKILEPDQSQTQTGERLMTPEFASPEQIRGGAHSASSDIYSLGAVLYTLLTGRSPHALEPGSITDIAWAICHREPATATRLKPDLPKDLDFILAKALRKEPEERYQSVDALAEDVRAFLEWRPVRARSGNTWYRMRKFTRRYRILVAAAALTVAGLSIGLYVANRERALAQRQFLQVRQMASKWIDLDTDVRGLRNSVPARKRILSTSLEYLARIGADAGKDRDLNLEIAAEYLQVARLQGVPEESNLGQFAEAEQSLRKAGALADSVLSRSPHDLAALQLSTKIAYNRLMLASFQDRYVDVATHARKVMSQIKQLEAGGTSIGEYQRMYDEAKQQSSQTAVGASEASGINASIRAAAGATGVILNSWGDNQYGQLGIGSFTDSLTPTPSTAPGRLVAIDAGWVHQLALRSDGTVWAWGRNSDGQLGFGSHTSSAVPKQIRTLSHVSAIATGYDHSLAITSDGSLWTWGSNFTGQLGNGTKTESAVPARVPELKNIVAADGGGAHSVAARSDGTVWAWGYNSNWQLGHKGPDTTTPVPVAGLTGAVAVAAGGAFTVALKSDGTVWGWGMNCCGQLGDGSNMDSPSPVRAAGLTRVVAIAAGDQYTLALKADGTVWAWGAGTEGELGNGTNSSSRIPTRVAGLSDIVAISAAPEPRMGHNLAVKADGTVWAWGLDDFGQLGDGNRATGSNVAAQVPGVRGAVKAAAGGGHSLVLLSR